MRKFVLICQYTGPNRHSNPLGHLPKIEIVGPFDTAKEAAGFGETYMEFCEEHTVSYLLDPETGNA